MVAPRYSPDQLRHLRKSPLVVKPDDLPSIEQWVEIGQSKPRTQSGFGKDGDDVLRRPIFENRHTSRQSKGTDEIFLGPPKTSFGSALSKSKTADFVDKSSTNAEGIRTKPDRLSARERPRRDKEYESASRRDRDHDRDRHDQSNGFDGRSRIRNAKIMDGEEEGYPRAKDRNAHGRDTESIPDPQIEKEEENGPKKHAFGRGSRFDQPWIRGDENREAKEASVNHDGGWRNHNMSQSKDWQKNTRPEKDPEWVNDAGRSDQGNHTQEDFQKWKEKMRASTAGNDGRDGESSASPSGITSTPTPSQEVDAKNFFGMWGEQKKDEGIPGVVSTSKSVSAKSKPSRFAGFFSPPPQADQAPSPPQRQPVASTDEAVAFQRVLQMLSLTPQTEQAGQDSHNDVSRNAVQRAFYQPDAQAQEHEIGSPERSAPLSGPTPDRWLENVHPDRPAMQHMRQVETDSQDNYLQNENPHRVASSQDESGLPKQIPNAERVFLYNLMQQPPVPFNEGQIYGQSFRQDHPNGVSSVLSDMSAKSKSPMRPPGFFNDQAYNQNQAIDHRFHVDPGQNHPERFDLNRAAREEFERMHLQMPPLQMQPRDGPPFWGPGNRPPSQNQQDMMAPPPGIGRGPGPLSPGFAPPYGSGPPGAPNMQQPRGGPPPQFPPGFGAPPPGFGQLGMPNLQHAPPPGYPQRRPLPPMSPQGPIPPHFEGFPRREGQPGMFPGFMKP